MSQGADVFEEWVAEANCDRFNVAYASNLGSFEDVIELLVPELQRCLMWDDCDLPGGTFRENILGQRTLRDDHYGSNFKYGRGKVKSVEVEKPAAVSFRMFERRMFLRLFHDSRQSK